MSTTASPSAKSAKEALLEVKERLTASASETADDVAAGVQTATHAIGDSVDRASQTAEALVEQASSAVAEGATNARSLASNAADQLQELAEHASDASLKWAGQLGKYARANPALTLLLGTVGGIVLGRLLASRPIVVEPRRRRRTDS